MMRISSQISVIVPVYNVEKYIRRCIDSIIAQLFTDYELILIDDGSPDRSGYICDEYAKKDDRITVLHKKNGGLSDARNVGIDWTFDISNSEWITFIDSDDWIHPRYLGALYNAIKVTDCEISICGYEETEGVTPEVDETKLKAETIDTEAFFCEHNVNAVIACGKLYKKELFKEIRYPVGKLHEDEFTTYKLLFQYPQLSVVSSPLYFYYCNPNSITQSSWSPEKLAALEAIKHNVVFFEKEDYHFAYVRSLEKLRWGLQTQYNAIVNSKNFYSRYNDVFIKYYRFLLRKGKKVNLFPFENNKYFYEIAYPKHMYFYWILKGFISRFRR